MGCRNALRAAALTLVTSGAWVASTSLGSARDGVARESAAPRSAEGLVAWQQVYSVLPTADPLTSDARTRARPGSVWIVPAWRD
jgi:hypothetical protein